MAFTAADVKNLREMTGVGMMDCKKALTASDGDMDKAVEFLREKGLAASAKKAGRVAAEGMAYAAVIDGVGVVVEVNAETDFVGKNEKFVDFVKGVAATVAANKPADLEALMACKYNGTDLTVEQQQQEMVLVIGENIKVRRFAIFTEGVSVPYIHAGGKIGVLVNLKVEGDIDASAAGKDVAMQIAALNPRFWDKSQVSQDVLDEEKKIMMVQMENDPKMANKPERISISVIKANYTCGMIERTGVFNLSLLTKEVPFAFFQHFGFQSGADVDKFADWTDCARSDNGLYYINRYTNAMFSCRVVESYDQGSHRLFIAEITESKLFSNDETVTYDYYRSHIKPAPPKLAPAEKATWVCSVCGYVYEGETLPADFICPLCKHPASDFVKHEAKPAEKRVGFVCTVCGYVYEGADMPDDFVCPLCHHPKSDFKPLE